MIKNKEKKIISRRKFLKKTAYAAPSLIILGQLLEPTPASGSNNSGPMQLTNGQLNQANKRVK
jgi:hypothetical protein